MNSVPVWCVELVLPYIRHFRLLRREFWRAVVQAIYRRPLTAENLIQYQSRQCWIYNGQSGAWTGVSLTVSVSFSQFSIFTYIMSLTDDASRYSS